jgi:small subunit ribosomal protein S1
MELQKEELEKFYADSFKGVQEGEILKGKIIQVRKDGVIVDIGTKCEGFVPAVEFSSDEFKGLSQGNEIEVYLINTGEFEDFVRLSKQQATQIKTWQLLEEAFQGGQHIEGEITGKVKGGMKVEIDGVKAFLPGSQIDLKTPKNTDQLIGKVYAFKVLNINNKRSNVIVSRRVVLEEEREQLKEELLSKIEEGAEITGVVKNLTDYGAFIDLGGIDGLLHISDMSWGRISHPGELFRIGEKVTVIVLKFDRNSERVTLGYKQRKPNPWSTADSKYSPGKRVTGKIINIVDYGIFIELEEGLEGLVHVSEFDWIEKIKKPSKYFSVGDTVEAVVLQVNSTDKRISLSIKQLKPNPWDMIKQNYSVGQKITGTVKGFTEFGAFLSLEEGVDALLHISDMSWTKHIKHPSEILKKGQEIEAVILSIDTEKERIAVGLKELNPDPWIEEIPKKFILGDHVKGKIVRISNYGLFIELDDDVEGLIYSSEIEKSHDERFEDIYKVGTELTARIIKIDPAERKIGLSMKAMTDFEV